MKHVFFFFCALFCFAFTSPMPVSAQGNLAETIDAQSRPFAGERGAGFRNPRDPREIAAQVINILLGLLGVLFVVYMIYGGALIMLSAGEEDKIANGKKTITRAVIGLIIILAAYSITLVVTRLAQGKSITSGLSACVYNEDTQEWYTRDTAHLNNPTLCPNPSQ